MRPILALLAAVVLAAAGCTEYRFVVRRDGAPIYKDEDRRKVIGRMERLDDGYIGRSEPEGDPVPIKFDGREGYADRKDLRIFSNDDDAGDRAEAIFLNRREVILEGKDWPANLEQAIREDRIENGMTREMVELAWGRPTRVETLEKGGERWLYARTRWEYRDDVHYDYWGGSPYFYYGGYHRGHGYWGHSYGYGYEFSHWEPHYYRTYYARTETRTVTFGGAGTVVGWESSRF